MTVHDRFKIRGESAVQGRRRTALPSQATTRNVKDIPTRILMILGTVNRQS